MKKHNQLHPKSAELLKILATLVDEFAYTEGNLPRKKIEEELFKTLDKILHNMENGKVNGLASEDIAEDVLYILSRQNRLLKLFMSVLEDYADGIIGQKAHEEFLASGEKTISLEELTRKYGLG